ncbi:MAG TPA: MBL fold metallo-hydrolase [Longimicrobium sp.]|jgi:glyoxylase-like metal-dependent hydrolase (beta-lactamase superfamily II)|uniref:MBL fold metallo-hydrolase n=1 Tax=Longimicrobium sp. TaxID=2029185 RepID=UPI002EDA7EDD
MHDRGEVRLHREAEGVTRIDHGWRGAGFIASYLVEEGNGLALVEAGPSSTLDTLLAGIRAAGRDPADLTHLLLTHIHLDHAAAAGHLARLAPRARVVVHPLGAPHLADPSRLLASAARIYGGAMDLLWGTMLPVDRERIDAAADGTVVRVGGRTLRAVETPGHADHHHAWHDAEAGLLFSGDAGGIRLDGARHVRPPTPPPDVDTARWLASLRRMRALRPRILLPTHFGGVDDPEWHLDDAERRLRAWTETAGRFDPADGDGLAAALRDTEDAALLEAGGDPALVGRYAETIPYPMMAAGLLHQRRRRERDAR